MQRSGRGVSEANKYCRDQQNSHRIARDAIIALIDKQPLEQAGQPAPQVKAMADFFGARIRAVEAEMADDEADAQHTGERVDLRDYVVEVPLPFARRILSALSGEAQG